MNNHPSIHRNAKVKVTSTWLQDDAIFVEYSGIIMSADNLGITVDAWKENPTKEVWEEVERGEMKTFNDHYRIYGTYFLPWHSVAEVEVL